MKRFALLFPLLAMGLFAQDGDLVLRPAVYHPSASSNDNYTDVVYRKRNRRMSHRTKNSVKRIGGGAAGGAVAGALIGGAPGAAIGAGAGAGVGAIYDHHKRSKGQ